MPVVNINPRGQDFARLAVAKGLAALARTKPMSPRSGLARAPFLQGFRTALFRAFSTLTFSAMRKPRRRNFSRWSRRRRSSGNWLVQGKSRSTHGS